MIILSISRHRCSLNLYAARHSIFVKWQAAHHVTSVRKARMGDHVNRGRLFNWVALASRQQALVVTFSAKQDHPVKWIVLLFRQQTLAR